MFGARLQSATLSSPVLPVYEVPHRPAHFRFVARLRRQSIIYLLICWFRLWDIDNGINKGRALVGTEAVFGTEAKFKIGKLVNLGFDPEEE
jgi:hypothetical protein